MLAEKLYRCLSVVSWFNVLGPLPCHTRGAANKHTCDTNVESTVGVTASPTVAVFILFMAATWSSARRGLVDLSSLE